MSAPPVPSRMRILGLSAVVVLSNAAGNYALNWGMKHGGLFTFWTAGGVLVLIFWTLARLRLLAQADLSYVLPVTSIGYLIPLVLGGVWLNEDVSGLRWLGALCIVAGAGLVSPTAPDSRKP